MQAGEVRNGMTVEFEGKVYQVLEFLHVKPGKGAAFVRTKLKDVINGGVVEKTFRPTENLNTAHIDRKEMQYLYADDDFYNFMDGESFETIPVAKADCEEQMKFVKENDMCKLCSYQGKVFSVEPPIEVELEITDTEPGFAGNTATNATKPATVETGAEIRVPLFVNVGDRILIDTRTSEYKKRV